MQDPVVTEHAVITARKHVVTETYVATQAPKNVAMMDVMTNVVLTMIV